MKSMLIFAPMLCIIAFSIPACTNPKPDQNKPVIENPLPETPKKDTMQNGNMTMDHSIMESTKMTMDQMHAMKMTGDFDLDFANMMILHHQAAIDMSEAELLKGMDAEIKTMAQKMINAQKTEIIALQTIAGKLKTSSSKMAHKEMHNELGETMMAMMNKMNALQMTGNTDKNFVMMMVPHHEAAMTMSEDELSHGKNAELKKIAQKIISDQQREIVELKAWQSTHH